MAALFLRARLTQAAAKTVKITTIFRFTYCPVLETAVILGAYVAQFGRV